METYKKKSIEREYPFLETIKAMYQSEIVNWEMTINKIKTNKGDPGVLFERGIKYFIESSEDSKRWHYYFKKFFAVMDDKEVVMLSSEETVGDQIFLKMIPKFIVEVNYNDYKFDSFRRIFHQIIIYKMDEEILSLFWFGGDSEESRIWCKKVKDSFKK